MNRPIKTVYTVLHFHFITFFVVLFCAGGFGKTVAPVYLLSGQSNMVGMQCQISGIPADQSILKNPQPDVYINLDAEGDSQKKKKWLNLSTGFGTNASTFGPEVTFGKTLSDSMPGKKILLIKNAVSGTSLASNWRPPSSGGTTGTLYKNMMTHIDNAMKSISTVLDTAQYTPKWAGFVWLQGEFDAMNQNDANAYETNLTNLIKDIRAKVDVPDLPVILPMIDVQSLWTFNSIVRQADINVKKKLTNVDTMDTKGLPTNGIHYQPLGQIKIGQVSAQRWRGLKYPLDDETLISRACICSPSTPITAHPVVIRLFDLAGRTIPATTSRAGCVLARDRSAGYRILMMHNHRTGTSSPAFLH